jgi:heterodisulfide reductase subunit A
MTGRIISEFDAGMGKRAPIYVPFPQAVPLKYTIDPETCLFLSRGVCGKTFKCKDACPADAIDFEMKEEIIRRDAQAIIVAVGFDAVEGAVKPELGYGTYPEVISGLEFERLVSSSGPTSGKINIRDKVPQDIVFIHCVGSRDRTIGHPWCSRVCCMYTAKQAHLVHEKIPGANVTVFYMDIRAFGKGFEEFYDRVREEGAVYRRGNPAEVLRRNDRLVVRAEDTVLGDFVEVEADMVVLAVGLQPRPETRQLADMLKLELSPDGFFQELHHKMRPVETGRPAVFLAGCAQGPKDIPDTVAQAKAAASSALIVMRRVEQKIEDLVQIP